MAKRTDYEPYGHFMLRAPLLSVGFLTSIPNHPELLYPWLRNQWNDPFLREGLALASHEFSRQVGRCLSPDAVDLPDGELLFALLRYLCRFASRCTPFGLFAGFATGTIGNGTSVELGVRGDHHLHTRPDMEFLAAIARRMEADPAIRESLVYRPNTSLYRIGREWHYIEVIQRDGNPGKQYDVVTIEDQGIISGLLEFCSTSRTPLEIRQYLAGPDREVSEIRAFVDSLITAQVMVSNLQPVVCGPEYFQVLKDIATGFFPDHPLTAGLERMVRVFDRMDRPLAVSAGMADLDSILSEIPVTTSRNHLIQADLRFNARSLVVDNRLAGQVLLAVRILKALSGRRHGHALSAFVEAFRKRYGDRKVELVRVLDPETGIGLDGSSGNYWTDPSSWIDDLGWGGQTNSGSVEVNPGNGWLNRRYLEAIRQGETYIDLNPGDLQAIGIHEGSWPAQMTAMVELFHQSDDEEIQVHYLMGAPGNPSHILGRFGFADPGFTRDWILQLMSDVQEDEPDVVFAEVVHLPEDRTGNILQRPSYLDREIPYLAQSVQPGDRKIPVTDLQVSISDGRILLTSIRTGKEIKPCMTNAYNHQIGHLTLYKFLHLVQVQDSQGAFLPDWGDLIRQSAFIPGIRFRNILLASPVWTIDCQRLAEWIHPGTMDVNMAALKEWRLSRGMPAAMVLMSSDQELYVNWDHPVLILSLWDAIRKHRTVRLRPFHALEGTPVKSDAGSHANQFIFCFRKK